MLFIISNIENTFESSLAITSWRPFIGGNNGEEPVAFIIRLGFKLFTKSTVASVFLNIYKFSSFSALFIKYCGKSYNLFLSGILEISVARPPKTSFFSSKNVVHPTSAAVHAASSPAVPAPITTTEQCF